MTSPILQLEQARDFVESGRPARAWPLLRRSFPSVLAAEADFLRGESRRAQGFFSQALAFYQKALRRLDPRAERDMAAEAALGCVRVLRSLGRTREAGRFLEEARRFRADSKAVALEAALLDRAAEKYGKSLAQLARLLSRARRRGDQSEIGFLLWASGGARRFNGDLDGSRRDFQESLKAFERARDREGAGYALFGLGGVSRILGRLGDSRRYYAAAGKSFDRGDDIFGRAYAYCGLANVLRQMGRLDEAEARYRKSWVLYRALGDEVDLAYVEWGLGKVFLQKGALSDAVARFERALASFLKYRETRGVVIAEVALAQALHSLGQSRKAEALFDRAYQRARRAGIHAHLEIFT